MIHSYRGLHSALFTYFGIPGILKGRPQNLNRKADIAACEVFLMRWTKASVISPFGF